MFIGWYSRASGELIEIKRKPWDVHGLMDFAERILHGGLKAMRKSDVLAAWHDDGPGQWMRVMVIAGPDLSQRESEVIEALAQADYSKVRGLS